MSELLYALQQMDELKKKEELLYEAHILHDPC